MAKMARRQAPKHSLSAESKEDGEVLVSNERLSCDSPVMWPDQNFCKQINFS